MISLNGIELNNNMVWVERFAAPEVVSSLKYTMGGRPIVQIGATRKKDITLAGKEDSGWLVKSVVDQLIELIDDPLATYELIFGTETHIVSFRFDEHPVVDMKPLVPRVLHVSTDLFYGILKLRRVS